MNAERLHTIALAIKQSFDATNTQSQLEQLVNSLQQQVQNPGHAPFQQQVSSIRNNLLNALDQDQSETFPPSWKQVIKEIGASDLLGRSLKLRVEAIFSRNQITPAAAQSDLASILSQIQNFRKSLDALIASLQSMKIGHEELANGEAEIGILIPRDFVGNDLERFANELDELDTVLAVFSELGTGTGSRPPFSIRSISSSDLTIFLLAAPAVCASLAKALDFLLAKYQQILEIRKLRESLKNQGVPDTKLASIDQHADDVIAAGIEELVPQLIAEFFSNAPQERQNELATELKFRLKELAARIDRGFNIEIRISRQLPDQSSSDSEPNQSERFKVNQQIIDETAKRRTFQKLGGTPILSLPDPTKAPRSKKRG